ncbi:MAG TPA: glycosyltransferase [Nitrolancea sp.]|nr:glycosyltransferase [Nitrolancea sp.]
MSETKLVSVIIIFWNAEPFLAEAVASVVAQTYPHWELLLVDDGSTDGSTALAQQLVAIDPQRIRYLEHPGHANRGMSASRNLGIDHAYGTFLAFLDADDVWLPEKLSHQVQILEERPEAALVYGPTEWWYSWSGRDEDRSRDVVAPLGVSADTLLPPPLLVNRFFFRQDAAIPGPSSILVRREIVEQVGGFEESFRGAYEDQAFYAKVCLRAPVLATGQCTDRYRQHPYSNSSSSDRTGQDRAHRLIFLNWLSDYFEAQGVSDVGLQSGLKRAIWTCRYPRLARMATTGRSAARTARPAILEAGRRTIPAPARRWVLARLTGTAYTPPPGWVRFGSLRRLTPLSRQFGYDRGQPVDRHYIERFLGVHASDIRGHVLEIADDTYTRRFGGERVSASDVLHVAPGQPQATIAGDLTCAETLPANTFDCVILTQTVQFIYDVPAALRTISRALKPGGVLLATFPGITPISRYDMERWGHFWSFTTLSARRLFDASCSWDAVQVESFGNVLTASAVLYGLAAEELRSEELNHHDPDYEVIIAVRATKAERDGGTSRHGESDEAGVHHLGL